MITLLITIILVGLFLKPIVQILGFILVAFLGIPLMIKEILKDAFNSKERTRQALEDWAMIKEAGRVFVAQFYR